MQDTLTFSFPHPHQYPPPHYDPILYYSGCNEIISSSTSTPFVSAPSSPSRMKGFYFSAPTSPSWAQRTLQTQHEHHVDYDDDDDDDQQQHLHHHHQVVDAQMLKRKMNNKKKKHQSPSPSSLDEDYSIITHHSPRPLVNQINQEEDADDACYSRRSFYANAVPFSWEEKAGTPKARLRGHTTDANPNEEDTSSIFLSGSSEFEFSSRFSELEFETPMSPTPISSSFKAWAPCDISVGSTNLNNANNHISHDPPQYRPSSHGESSNAYGSYHLSSPCDCTVVDSPEGRASYTSRVGRGQYEWPLRPPPRLEVPIRNLIREDERCMNSYMMRRSSKGAIDVKSPPRRCTDALSLSVPQSPRTPLKSRVRRALLVGQCYSKEPASSDPFDLGDIEANKGHHRTTSSARAPCTAHCNSSSSSAHHRRTHSHSHSPLRIFHWDEPSSKSNSSSNGSLKEHEVKSITPPPPTTTTRKASSSSSTATHSKHPIHKEINSCGLAKGISRRWSFRGLLNIHKKAGGSSSLRSNSSSSSTGGCSASSASHNTDAVAAMELEGISKGRSNPRPSPKPTLSHSSKPNPSWKPSPSTIDSANLNRNQNPNSSPYADPKGAALSPATRNRGGGTGNVRSTCSDYALHYRMQRAQAEELKKKTLLPYRHGLLGCLGISSKSYYRAFASLSKPLHPNVVIS